jgi:hypothetical protein
VGIAFLNARRHRCIYCLLLNIMALRGTPGLDLSGDHRTSAKLGIATPLDGQNWRYSVKRYCHPNINRMNKKDLTLVLTTADNHSDYKYEDADDSAFQSGCVSECAIQPASDP